MGAPGCPLLAFSTASIERNRMALMDRHATSLLMVDSERVWTFDKAELGEGLFAIWTRRIAKSATYVILFVRVDIRGSIPYADRSLFAMIRCKMISTANLRRG